MAQEQSHTDAQKSYERDEVVRIINSALEKARKSDAPAQEGLYQELQELRDIIEESRRELGMAGAGDIPGKDIPTATDELDAVVGATEEASGNIMDSCEVIQGYYGDMDDETAQKVEAEVTKIFEACSFQDITGQRIGKVISTLQKIEEKVGKIMAAAGGQTFDGNSADNEDERTGDEALLNGPQLEGQGVSQDDIDKLLAEFDE